MRSTIITLKDEIEFKEQKISELKHEIYRLKMKVVAFEGNANSNQQQDVSNTNGQNAEDREEV